MLDLGFIDKEEEMRAKESKPKIIAQNIGSIKTPHFVMMVRDYLSSKYGEGIVENGGFKVITTIDASLQGIAERAVGEGANRNAEAYDGRNAALVAQDPKTGQILALVGSKDYFGDSEPAGCDTNPKISCQFEGNFNVAAQGLRQPGSSFKPFAYIAALKQGYSPETVVFDLPTEFSTYKNECPLLNINFANENSRCFHPENFDHQFRGPVNLRNSLAQSINIPSVKILYLAGISNTIKTAEDFGITTLNDPYRYGLSLVLGGGEVKLIDMVGAYSVFAQDGIKHQQAFILEIKDSDGKILENFVDLKTQVIEAQYARQINDILSDKSARSPLFQNSLNLTTFPEHEVALKTGTTNNYKDAWTIGYTPYLAAGVWAGNNNNKPMQKQAGSILAAVPIWHAFMSEALLKFESENFPRPEPVPQEKPMLNGQIVVNSRVHDILFYVDKNDPLGQQPQNPEEDSQFLNWELPAEEWVKNHGLNNLPTYIPPARNASSGMNQTLTPTQL
ncbi:hypothetical protein HY227_01980 [Candidatus Wolfebacteria bacterium]|nr:hypothetical protein [Candidatus Wolfebacteria bacterium]